MQNFFPFALHFYTDFMRARVSLTSTRVLQTFLREPMSFDESQVRNRVTWRYGAAMRELWWTPSGIPFSVCCIPDPVSSLTTRHTGNSVESSVSFVTLS